MTKLIVLIGASQPEWALSVWVATLGNYLLLLNEII